METLQIQNGQVIITTTSMTDVETYIAQQQSSIDQYNANIAALQTQINDYNQKITDIQSLITQAQS